MATPGRTSIDSLSPAYEELEFDLGDVTLRARRYGSPDGIPVLALHGWLDNCASFHFLAAQLPQLNLVALDLAGHGRSDHRPHIGAYNIWTDTAELYHVVQQLGWRKFALIGHSRGAMIAMIMAGTFPELVTHLVTIECLFPWVEKPENAPQQLALSIEGVLDQLHKKRHYYTSFERAVVARENGFFKLSAADAKTLAERGVLNDGQGFYWGNDAKLLAPSELRLTHEQVHAFMRRIEIPVELYIASQGLMVQEEPMLESIRKYKNVVIHMLEGEHHLHMSQQYLAMSEKIGKYFDLYE
ncbi:alpha/beta fold hydrolase [Teredinibacter sp. KSP-S5-2]|uniref:alpha/beta fold hydrolase n=1 Tax=Teredinibacter sp. KSP-S5-2 TaxID=3034506 RepID=UPI0029350EA7|nr:alpha/beta fold hydrolase [Teredinibacter sp. KSP-S5-2]WNO10960.1 alpha/beta fold hydrolase [Teredinibacter sp. KSP-S5-2]